MCVVSLGVRPEISFPFCASMRDEKVRFVFRRIRMLSVVLDGPWSDCNVSNSRIFFVAGVCRQSMPLSP